MAHLISSTVPSQVKISICFLNECGGIRSALWLRCPAGHSDAHSNAVGNRGRCVRKSSGSDGRVHPFSYEHWSRPVRVREHHGKFLTFVPGDQVAWSRALVYCFHHTL